VLALQCASTFSYFLQPKRDKNAIRGNYFWKIEYRGQCYDHNFLRFGPIFREKNCDFLQKQWHGQFLAHYSGILSQIAIFMPFILRKKS
jgi:hypothetical protein